MILYNNKITVRKNKRRRVYSKKNYNLYAMVRDSTKKLIPVPSVIIGNLFWLFKKYFGRDKYTFAGQISFDLKIYSSDGNTQS